MESKGLLTAVGQRVIAWTPWLALFGTIVSARLWLISGYGSALPFHDQWDAEAAYLFKPWLENTLRWPDLFSPHNEHRIVLSRVLALGLLQVNGQWDALLQMTVNALLAGLIGLIIAAALLRTLGNEYRFAILACATLWLALPYAHENTLWGFQSSFYFLLCFSFVALWGLGFFPAYSWNWWLGAVASVLACFSAASGFFAAGIVLILETIRLLWKRRGYLEAAPTCVVAIAVIALGFYFQATYLPHESLKAASVGAWFTVFARSLAWPFPALPILAALMYLPWAIGTFLMVTTTETLSRARTEMLFAVGLWVIAQAAAIAYGRGGNGSIPIASRYMDILGLGTLVNALSLVLLARSNLWSRKWRTGTLALSSVWIAASFAGVAYLCFQKLSSGAGKEALLPMEQNVRAYVATGDRKYLAGDIPYPDANHLAGLLDDPTIRNILPAIVRPAVPLKPRNETGHAFIADGYPPEIANPPFERTWGSYSPSAPEARGSIETESFRPGLPFLQFQLAGTPRSATMLSLHDSATGKGTRVTANIPVGRNWREGTVRVHGSPVHIIARDDSMEDWIAFREPRELGRLSYYAQKVVSHRQNLFRAGVAILAVAITGALLASFQNQRLEKPRN